MSGDPSKITLSEELSMKFNNVLSVALLTVTLLMKSEKGSFFSSAFSIGIKVLSFTY